MSALALDGVVRAMDARHSRAVLRINAGPVQVLEREGAPLDVADDLARELVGAPSRRDYPTMDGGMVILSVIGTLPEADAAALARSLPAGSPVDELYAHEVVRGLLGRGPGDEAAPWSLEPVVGGHGWLLRAIPPRPSALQPMVEAVRWGGEYAAVAADPIRGGARLVVEARTGLVRWFGPEFTRQSLHLDYLRAEKKGRVVFPLLDGTL